jgi:hypothetical protein
MAEKKTKAPTQEMWDTAAKRARERDEKKPKKAPAIPKDYTPPPEESKTIEEALRDVEMEKKMKKGEEASVRGYKKGGMVTARGQGRVTRKGSTRIC